MRSLASLDPCSGSCSCSCFSCCFCFSVGPCVTATVTVTASETSASAATATATASDSSSAAYLSATATATAVSVGPGAGGRGPVARARARETRPEPSFVDFHGHPIVGVAVPVVGARLGDQRPSRRCGCCVCLRHCSRSRLCCRQGRNGSSAASSVVRVDPYCCYCCCYYCCNRCRCCSCRRRHRGPAVAPVGSRCRSRTLLTQVRVWEWVRLRELLLVLELMLPLAQR